MGFFFNDTATTEIYTLSLHDALPICLPKAQEHTTHFVVADREGNAVSATQTLGNLFGSRVMPRGTGIWINDSLAFAQFEPKGNPLDALDRKSTRLNSSHANISYAVFCLKKKQKTKGVISTP